MGPTVSLHSANGIRTRVWALRGPRPSPLDDSAVSNELGARSRELGALSIAHLGAHHYNKLVVANRSLSGEPHRKRSSPCSQLLTPSSLQQARQDSNLQPPVLETGALPLELRTSEKQLGAWSQESGAAPRRFSFPLHNSKPHLTPDS
jgi:hypothetical protein